MSPRVTVSIVNWNTRDALERCLRALTADVTWSGDIVVVDNASSDDSAAMVQGRFPSVHLIANDHNDGFAGANNSAISAHPADYVLILNPDVEVEPGAIAGLVRFMENTPRAAAAAPALVGVDGELQPHLYRRFPSVAQILLSWTVVSVISQRIAPLRRRISEHDIRGTTPICVDQVPGAAMLIRRAALEQVGLLDPGYFIWFEDVDWCYRARRAGYRIYVVPEQRARHEGGASFERWSLQTRAFQFYRAFFRFLCKHRLDGLVRIAMPVLTLDLLLKEAIVRVRQATGLPLPGDVQTLAPTRQAMREVVQRCRAGELVDFTSADVPVIAPVRHTLPSPEPPADAGSPVDVVIVNWNGRRYLPGSLAALKASSVAVRIIVVDNASTDGSAEWIHANHADVEIIALPRNVGYAAAANEGLRRGSAAYAMIMNPDVHLMPDHLAILAGRLDSEPGIGAAQGKLYQTSAEDFERGRFAAVTIDSAGHAISRTRMVVDRGQGREDAVVYSTEASVFSACGAALFLRRVMLDDIAADGEYFSESFFAYKEDVDLGWRARLRGWDIRYVPAAIAHHVRNAPFTLVAWRGMPLVVRQHSWKNHYLLMIRNDRVQDVLRVLPLVAAWEVARVGYALLRDPRVLGGYVAAAREVKGALRARRIIHANRRATTAEMRRWFGGGVVAVYGATASSAMERA